GAVGKAVAAGEDDLLSGNVERLGAPPEAHVEPELLRLLGREERGAPGVPLPGEDLLRERRLVVRPVGLGPEEDDLAVVPLRPQPAGHGDGGHRGADDDDPPRGQCACSFSAVTGQLLTPWSACGNSSSPTSSLSTTTVSSSSRSNRSGAFMTQLAKPW